MSRCWSSPGVGVGVSMTLAGILAAGCQARPAAEPRPAARPAERPAERAAPKTTTEPPANRALAEVGRRIFFDETLSEPAGTSCASCHDPSRGFAGGRLSDAGVSRGSRAGRVARRTTPSVLYLAYVRPLHLHWEEDAPLPDAFGGFFWDGRVDSLAALAEQPLRNPDEMNGGDRETIAAKLRRAPYADDLRRLLGADALATGDASLAALGRAVEAFLLGADMAPFSSQYDELVRHGTPLPPLAQRGMELFRNPEKGNCASCHRFNPGARDPARSLFTDFGYEALAVPRNHALVALRGRDDDLGLCARQDAALHSDDPRFCASFRTPSLRNVAARPSFMHNGALADLRDVVAFYATRSTHPRRWYRSGSLYEEIPARYHTNVNNRRVPYDRGPGEKPRLDDAEIDALVAFLETLTDAPFRPAADAHRKTEVSLRSARAST
jgi:cytochrome c peroxidase